MKEREREHRDEDGEALGAALRQLPTPMAPPALVARVRRLAHARLAAQGEERRERLLLVGVLLFSWPVSLFTFGVMRALSGQGIGLSGSGPQAVSSAAYLAATWILGAAGLVLMAVYARKKRRTV